MLDKPLDTKLLEPLQCSKGLLPSELGYHSKMSGLPCIPLEMVGAGGALYAYLCTAELARFGHHTTAGHVVARSA